MEKSYGYCFICKGQHEIESIVHHPKRMFLILKCGHQTNIELEGIKQSSWEMGIPDHMKKEKTG